jgi:CDP-diacylglycerol--glycerol-3-phosphate 3-phosphatidyltransferase
VASVYDLKPRFQALWRPLVRRLAGAGVTANQVTVSAALLSIAVGAWLAVSHGSRAALIAVPALFFIRMALNAIDGMLAREHGQKSRLGAILNEVGDVISDAALYLPFALVPGFSPTAIVVIVVLAIVSEMTGVVGVQIGASRRYDGPMGKSDRAFVFGALSLALACGAPAGGWLEPVLWIVAALLAVTIVNRARRALAEAPPR